MKLEDSALFDEILKLYLILKTSDTPIIHISYLLEKITGVISGVPISLHPLLENQLKYLKKYLSKGIEFEKVNSHYNIWDADDL